MVIYGKVFKIRLVVSCIKEKVPNNSTFFVNAVNLLSDILKTTPDLKTQSLTCEMFYLSHLLVIALCNVFQLTLSKVSKFKFRMLRYLTTICDSTYKKHVCCSSDVDFALKSKNQHHDGTLKYRIVSSLALNFKI